MFSRVRSQFRKRRGIPYAIEQYVDANSERTLQ
jgi:hypothetical protein